MHMMCFRAVWVGIIILNQNGNSYSVYLILAYRLKKEKFIEIMTALIKEGKNILSRISSAKLTKELDKCLYWLNASIQGF